MALSLTSTERLELSHDLEILTREWNAEIACRVVAAFHALPSTGSSGVKISSRRGGGNALSGYSPGHGIISTGVGGESDDVRISGLSESERVHVGMFVLWRKEEDTHGMIIFQDFRAFNPSSQALNNRAPLFAILYCIDQLEPIRLGRGDFVEVPPSFGRRMEFIFFYVSYLLRSMLTGQPVGEVTFSTQAANWTVLYTADGSNDMFLQRSSKFFDWYFGRNGDDVLLYLLVAIGILKTGVVWHWGPLLALVVGVVVLPAVLFTLADLYGYVVSDKTRRLNWQVGVLVGVVSMIFASFARLTSDYAVAVFCVNIALASLIVGFIRPRPSS